PSGGGETVPGTHAPVPPGDATQHRARPRAEDHGRLPRRPASTHRGDMGSVRRGVPGAPELPGPGHGPGGMGARGPSLVRPRSAAGHGPDPRHGCEPARLAGPRVRAPHGVHLPGAARCSSALSGGPEASPIRALVRGKVVGDHPVRAVRRVGCPGGIGPARASGDVDPSWIYCTAPFVGRARPQAWSMSARTWSSSGMASAHASWVATYAPAALANLIVVTISQPFKRPWQSAAPNASPAPSPFTTSTGTGG